MKSNNFFLNNISLFFLFIYLLLGLYVVKDFGISVDEEFQRYSGFYWLNYIVDFTSFENFKLNVSEKLNSIEGFTLPDPKNYKFYGVAFDLPLAFIETLIKLENPKDYFLLRHYANFLIFFISSVYFYLIIKKRFADKFLVFFGLVLYLSSPRIFGESFYNNKDIIFLSLVTITIYYFFRFLDKKNFKNLITLGIFSSLTCALRIVGIFIPLSLIIFLLVSKKEKKYSWQKVNKFIIVNLTIFFIFLIIFWPYLWSNPISNFLYSLEVFSKYPQEFQMMFNGEYVNSKYLPLSYLPIWIVVTTPLIIIFFSLLGYLNLLKRFFLRLISIKEKMITNDFWRSKKESKDFFIFLNFNLIFFYIILSNTDIYNGWRHLYFLHVFIIYIACVGIYYLKLKFNKIRYFYLFFTVIGLFNFYEINKFHPYQSSYFNQLITENKKGRFEVDYWGLAGVKFLEEILLINEKNSKKIKIGVASFLPLERSLKLLSPAQAKQIQIVGQEYFMADYIFNNNISEVNKFKNNKYKIPDNFEKISEFYIKGFMMYEIFKKK